VSNDKPEAGDAQTIAPESRKTPNDAGETAAADVGDIEISCSPGLPSSLATQNISTGFTS